MAGWFVSSLFTVSCVSAAVADPSTELSNCTVTTSTPPGATAKGIAGVVTVKAGLPGTIELTFKLLPRP